MPLWSINLLLAICAVGALIAGIWLVVHFNAVAALVAGKGDMVASGVPPRVSRRKTILMLIVFNLGWMAAIGIWIFVITGAANQVVDANL
jgi:hypothetical protein